MARHQHPPHGGQKQVPPGAAQRPLAFVLGQGLWLCSPLEMLLPRSGLADWAALLSHPDSGLALENLLADALANDQSAPEASQK